MFSFEGSGRMCKNQTLPTMSKSLLTAAVLVMFVGVCLMLSFVVVFFLERRGTFVSFFGLVILYFVSVIVAFASLWTYLALRPSLTSVKSRLLLFKALFLTYLIVFFSYVVLFTMLMFLELIMTGATD